jgi:GntR family transcriptional regulator/MocR family aminotransferase
MILPERLMEDFNRIKGRYSQSVSKIEQLALAGYMSEGSFERHIRRIKKIYGKKNQLLIEAFKRYPTKNFKLIGKEAGLHVVLDFQTDVAIAKVVTMAKSMGVLLEGVDEYPDNRILVFSYSGIPDDWIDSVVKEIVEISDSARKI